MRQLGCMSADFYCQNLNNQLYAEMSYLYMNRKKGKQAMRQRDRESVCVRDREWLKRVGVRCKMAFGERLTILG
jgi:hypothetical protein